MSKPGSSRSAPPRSGPSRSGPPRSAPPRSGPSRSGLGRPRRTAAGIAVAVLAALYTFAAPYIEQRTGWDLPSLPVSGADSNDRVAAETEPSTSTAQRQKPTTAAAKEAPATAKRSPGPKVVATPTAEASDESSVVVEDLLYERLRDLGNERYLSTAGVLYTRGSAEGHRLEHLRRHTADQPSRPGKHGVFDGEMPGAIKTIDLAYEKAQAGQRTSVQKDRDRTVYTVDMGRRVGYIGGREGNRRRKPMARRVRMVMEGNRLITAYPL